MKNTMVLFALCVCFSFSAMSQSAAPSDQQTKRITITTKKVDENGKTITEAWIAEGDDPTRILEGMAINPGVMEKVRLEGDWDKTDQERLFLFRSAGEKIAIEGNLDLHPEDGDFDEVIIITGKEEGKDIHSQKHLKTRYAWAGSPKAYSYFRTHEKSNCAALGVWASNIGESKGAFISGLIENGGAQAAGLKTGDVIQKIDEFEVNDYTTLHLALAHFRPGDQVVVRFNRDGKSMKEKVVLKDWAELPGHEWRSRDDCGKPELPLSEDDSKVIQDDPSSIFTVQPLVLTDARLYPNPTDGVFNFSFTTDPGPLSVSVTDVNGKTIYHEENDNQTGFYNRDIDLENIPQGNYVISVKQGEKVFTQQISKQ